MHPDPGFRLPIADHDPLRFLAEAAAMAEEALELAVPPATAWPERLHAAMRHSLFAGGKRLRPALVLAASRACLGADPLCAPAMVAVECLHTYTLIHDDLPAMDDDDLRRGRPTCHKAFDEATAILAGDALQALAFAQVAELGAEAVQVLARAAGSTGVVGGQQDDLDAEGAGAEHIGLDRLHRIHAAKTGALIAASIDLGALAAGAHERTRAALAAYAGHLGLAFQIADDVLDATADARTLGKTPGKDAAQGKLTFVTRLGLDAARAAAACERDAAVAALAPLGREAGLLAAVAGFVVDRRH